jgi:hypothetical protein
MILANIRTQCHLIIALVRRILTVEFPIPAHFTRSPRASTRCSEASPERYCATSPRISINLVSTEAHFSCSVVFSLTPILSNPRLPNSPYASLPAMLSVCPSARLPFYSSASPPACLSASPSLCPTAFYAFSTLCHVCPLCPLCPPTLPLSHPQPTSTSQTSCRHALSQTMGLCSM